MRNRAGEAWNGPPKKTRHTKKYYFSLKICLKSVPSPLSPLTRVAILDKCKAAAARHAAHSSVLGEGARRAASALRRVRRANEAHARGIAVSLRRRACLTAAPHS